MDYCNICRISYLCALYTCCCNNKEVYLTMITATMLGIILLATRNFVAFYSVVSTLLSICALFQYDHDPRLLFLFSLLHSIRWAVALHPPHQSDSKIVHPSAQPAPDWENNLQPASFHTHYFLPLHAASRLLQAACGESVSQRETRSHSAKWGTMTPFLKTVVALVLTSLLLLAVQ